MTTQMTREQLLETTRTLPQQGSKSPHPQCVCKMVPSDQALDRDNHRISKLKMKSHQRDYIFLYLCCIWAALLVFMCIFVPLLSSDYNNFGNHCAPDGSFELEPSSLLAPTWFFQVVLGFGSLQFTAVKAIDIVWDVVSGFDEIKSLRQLLTLNQVVGRAGQTLLAYISWRTFSKYLYSVMVTDPITYQTFWTVFMEDGPSVWSILRTSRDFTRLRGLRSKPIMFFMILTMAFVLAFPTLASAMTGYSANNQAVVKTDDIKQVLFSQFNRVRYVINDGHRVSVGYPIASDRDESRACGFVGCIEDCKRLASSGPPASLTSLSAH